MITGCVGLNGMELAKGVVDIEIRKRAKIDSTNKCRQTRGGELDTATLTAHIREVAFSNGARSTPRRGNAKRGVASWQLMQNCVAGD